MNWRWRADGGDWHLDIDTWPVAMLCAHHDHFWSTVIGLDRQDFAKLDDAIARLAIDLLIRDLTAPDDARLGEVLVGTVAQLERRGVPPPGHPRGFRRTAENVMTYFDRFLEHLFRPLPFRSCEGCSHAEIHHDGLGRCHFDGCGCSLFFPKHSIDAAAERASVQGERVAVVDASQGVAADSSYPPVAEASANASTRDSAGAVHRAVLVVPSREVTH